MTDPSLAVVDGVRYLVYDKYARLGDLSSPAPAILKTDHSGSWVEHRLARDGWDALVRTDPSGRAHIVFQSASADGGGSVMRYVQVDPDTGEPTKSRRIPGTRTCGPRPRSPWTRPASRTSPGRRRRTSPGPGSPRMDGAVPRGWACGAPTRSPSMSTRPASPMSSSWARGRRGRGIIHAQRDAGAWPQSVIAGGRDWSRVTQRARWLRPRGRRAGGRGPGGLWSLGPLSAIDPAATGAHRPLMTCWPASPTAAVCPSPSRASTTPSPMAHRRPSSATDRRGVWGSWRSSASPTQTRWPSTGIGASARSNRRHRCATGPALTAARGQATWPHGELVCYRSTAPKEAKLRWIDERTNTYGVLDATDQDIARLHAVWTKLTE